MRADQELNGDQNLSRLDEQEEKTQLIDLLNFTVKNLNNEKNCILEQFEVLLCYSFSRLWKKNTVNK
jgi:hypothetical protein